MTAPANYGYEDATLNAVITATTNSIEQMERVNAQVAGLSSQLPTVNKSTSGVKLGGLLSDWTTEYRKVVGELNALNEKANGILITNRNVENETGSAPV